MKKEMREEPCLKRRRRKPSTPGALPITESQTEWSAHVRQYGLQTPSARRCPKCSGFLTIQCVDLSEKNDIRCINCGWQPQWGTRIVAEDDTIRTIREMTSTYSTQPDWQI